MLLRYAYGYPLADRLVWSARWLRVVPELRELPRHISGDCNKYPDFKRRMHTRTRPNISWRGSHRTHHGHDHGQDADKRVPIRLFCPNFHAHEGGNANGSFSPSSHGPCFNARDSVLEWPPRPLSPPSTWHALCVPIRCMRRAREAERQLREGRAETPLQPRPRAFRLVHEPRAHPQPSKLVLKHSSIP